MMAFYRYPHTPHLAWLGDGSPRADKVLPLNEAAEFLHNDVFIEEKIDGANLGFSVSKGGELQIQNRGSWLTPDSCHSQFRPLWNWLGTRRDPLIDALGPTLILFGEWCTTVHSVHYTTLPDWFLGFDVYDRVEDRFWSTGRRNDLLAHVGLSPVPCLAKGSFSLDTLSAHLLQSRVGADPMEGLYVRAETDRWLIGRAKLVRPGFVQAIDTHWSRGPLRRNQISPSTWS